MSVKEMEGDEEEGRRRQDIYRVPSVLSRSQHLDLQQKAGAKRGHGLGRFLFSSGPEGFAAHECMDLLVDIWPPIFKGG